MTLIMTQRLKNNFEEPLILRSLIYRMVKDRIGKLTLLSKIFEILVSMF